MKAFAVTNVVIYFITSNLPYSYGNKLLFFLVDGFRWDYFELPGVRLNGFARLFREGTRAEWMIPDFPTNSFPNYKTLETGTYAWNYKSPL